MFSALNLGVGVGVGSGEEGWVGVCKGGGVIRVGTTVGVAWRVGVGGGVTVGAAPRRLSPPKSSTTTRIKAARAARPRPPASKPVSFLIVVYLQQD
jgi:hypothetical protein